MDETKQVSIALTDDEATDLQAAVTSGEYGSVDEAVRDALRQWRSRREEAVLEAVELRRLAQEGIDSGPSLEAETVFARLRARYGVIGAG